LGYIWGKGGREVKKEMKAVAYYRVSSEKQKKTQSIDTQKLNLKGFAEEKGYKIVAEFEDDGIPGESIESRPGFLKALQRIEKGDVDVFLVDTVDRIGRFANIRDRNTVIVLLLDTETNVYSYDEDEGLFRWNSEKEINDLEDGLNKSRSENVKRGKKISGGHKTNRLKGRYSGGLLPYGVRFDEDGVRFDEDGVRSDKEKGVYYKVDKEVDTLEIIFQKITAGWGYGRVQDYLNDNPDLYPKRTWKFGLRKYKGKEVTKWSAEHIRLLVLNDFYFTGVVPRTAKSIAKGIPAMKTGIKLFDEDTVKIARREASNRRVRSIDPSRQGRKRIHSQQDKTVFTDALLHGIVRCGKCGWKLGLRPLNPGTYNYLYYPCRGRGKGKCDLRDVRADVLDKNVWREFVMTLSDPQKIEEMILKQNFIVDKNFEEKKAEYRTAEKNLKEIARAIEQTKKQHTWGDLTDDEYKAKMANLNRMRNDTEDKVVKIKGILERPKDVREAVTRSTEYLASELKKFETVKEIRQILKDKGKTRFKRRLRFPDDPELSKLYKKYKSAQDIMGKLELAGGDVETLIFQQKRTMLQKFIDHSEDKSIRVFDANHFDLNLYIRLDLFDDLGDE
jgi:DNA invertase Pin-like site-specific DNA recombinase